MHFINFLEYAVLLTYLTGSVLYPMGMLYQKKNLCKQAGVFIFIGFFLHTALLILLFFKDKTATFTQGGVYFSLLGWVLLLLFLVIFRKNRLEFMALAAGPFALLLYLASMAMPESRVIIPEKLSVFFVFAHVGSLLVSISFLALAFVAGVLFLYIEKKIKAKKKLESFHRDLPSLNTFDLVNKWAVNWGFPLYCVGMLTGFIFARFEWGRFLTGDVKEIVSILILVLYAFLFYGRTVQNYRGRKAAVLAMLVFMCSMASLFFVNFFTDSHHRF